MTTTLYCGIDLHSNNSVISIQDKSSKQVYEKRLPNDLPAILDALEPFKHDLQGCVVESTYNWYWLVDGLMEAGHQVNLANLQRLNSTVGTDKLTSLFQTFLGKSTVYATTAFSQDAKARCLSVR